LNNVNALTEKPMLNVFYSKLFYKTQKSWFLQDNKKNDLFNINLSKAIESTTSTTSLLPALHSQQLKTTSTALSILTKADLCKNIFKN
jgi:hypothetical protein